LRIDAAAQLIARPGGDFERFGNQLVADIGQACSAQRGQARQSRDVKKRKLPNLVLALLKKLQSVKLVSPLPNTDKCLA
jgi:hypothetical protein